MQCRDARRESRDGPESGEGRSHVASALEFEMPEGAMPDVTRFAGFPSPKYLVGDPQLTREDKIDALQSWRALVLRSAAGAEPAGRGRLIGEIMKALDRVRQE